MHKRLVAAAVLLFLLAPPLHAKEKTRKPTFDKKALTSLAARWFNARPKTQFFNWKRKPRQALLKELDALGEVPRGKTKAVIDLLMKAARRAVPPLKGTLESPYGPVTWIQKGKGGAKKGLVLGLHGGGPGSGSAKEAAGNWPVTGQLAIYPQAVRLVDDTWNTVHGERYLLTLIEMAKVHGGIDPNRVYSVGFSMGGSGSWFMAGRHPDLLAGAISAHGVLMAKRVKVVSPDDVGEFQYGFVPNVRNLAVYFYTGTDDKNCEPGTFRRAWQMIDALKKTDSDGYGDVRFSLHEGVAHRFPSGEPKKGLDYIFQHRRNPYPETLVWEYAESPFPRGFKDDKVARRAKKWFYWLRCALPGNKMQVRAVRSTTKDANIIDLTFKEAYQDDFTIYLNDAMIEPRLPVIVRVAGEEVYQGVPVPTYRSIFESFDARLDTALTFDRAIPLPEPRD